MARHIAQELQKIVRSDKNTRLSRDEIHGIAGLIAGTSAICSLSLRRAIECVAPRARVSDDFVEDAAARLQASSALR